MPYIFQILSQLLESQKTGTLSQDYLQLIPPLIHPDLWRTKANTIPLVRLLQAYLRRGATNVIQADKLDGMLGVLMAKSQQFKTLRHLRFRPPHNHLSRSSSVHPSSTNPVLTE